MVGSKDGSISDCLRDLLRQRAESMPHTKAWAKEMGWDPREVSAAKVLAAMQLRRAGKRRDTMRDVQDRTEGAVPRTLRVGGDAQAPAISFGFVEAVRPADPEPTE